MSIDGLLATSCELRAEAAPEAAYLDGSALSSDIRAGTSELCRGLPAAEFLAGDGLPAALLAATARANLSCSLSLVVRFVEPDLDGPIRGVSIR